MIKLFILCVFFSLELYSQNFFDISYADSNKGFKEYSFSYIHAFSTNSAAGIEYRGYDNLGYDINTVIAPINFYFRDYNIVFDLFYSLKKNNNSFYGFKGIFTLMKYKEEVVTNYSFSYSYAREDYTRSRHLAVAGFSFDKNYYDEFFITSKLFLALKNAGKSGFFDKKIFYDSYFHGFLPSVAHSMLEVGFARSFKPDFNSYIYFSFDRFNNGTKDTINSYNAGLKVYLEEKENYYIDVSYSMINHKTLSDERVFKLSIGGGF